MCDGVRRAGTDIEPGGARTLGQGATRTRRAALLLIGCAGALRQALLVGTFRFFVDDAYIFFRYARSVRSGDGLVFNAGQRVMGFSSPLYMLIVTGLAAPLGVGHLVGMVDALNLALFVASSLLIVDLARRGGAPLWAILPAWLLFFPFVSGAVNGMETMLFVALQLGALWLVVDDRADLAIVALALLVLTRPEGVVFAAVVIGAVWWTKDRPRQLPLAGAATAAALLGGWALFAWRYYGTVVPQSILAKGAIHGTSGTPIEKLGVLAVGLSSQQYGALAGPLKDVVVGLGLISAALAVVGVVHGLRDRSPWVILPAWFLLAWSFYALTDPIQIWSWYSMPVSLALWWTLAREGPPMVARAVGVRAEALVVALVVVAASASMVFGVGKRRDSLSQSVVALRSLSQIVTRSAPGAKSVMLDDIGIVGWSSRLVIVDSAGLVSPLGAQRSHGRLLSMATLAERTKPDVICLKVDPEAGTVTDPVFKRRLFDDAGQRSRLLGRYRLVPAVVGDYRACLVRNGL